MIQILWSYKHEYYDVQQSRFYFSTQLQHFATTQYSCDDCSSDSTEVWGTVLSGVKTVYRHMIETRPCCDGIEKTPRVICYSITGRYSSSSFIGSITNDLKVKIESIFQVTVWTVMVTKIKIQEPLLISLRPNITCWAEFPIGECKSLFNRPIPNLWMSTMCILVGFTNLICYRRFQWCGGDIMMLLSHC